VSDRERRKEIARLERKIRKAGRKYGHDVVGHVVAGQAVVAGGGGGGRDRVVEGRQQAQVRASRGWLLGAGFT